MRADSRIPNGEINFMKESIRVGFADLRNFGEGVSEDVRGMVGGRGEITFRRCNCSY